MSQGDLTIDGSQPIRLAVSSARRDSRSEISTFAGWYWIGDRRGVNSPDHRPNAARVNASLKTNSGKAVSAAGTDRMNRGLVQAPSVRDPFRHATSDNPRGVDGTAEFDTAQQHGLSWERFQSFQHRDRPRVPLFIKLVVLGVSQNRSASERLIRTSRCRISTSPGLTSEICLAIADGFLDERPCLVPLPIAQVEIAR